MARSAWIDLLDPSEEELREHVAHELRADAWAELMRPADPEGRSPRPSVKSHGNYVLGLLLAAVAVPEEDVVYYQEVDFVLSRERIVTVRKTPGERPPFDPSNIGDVCDAIEHEQSPGMIAYFLVDDVAERYIDLLDAVDEEIDELEEGIDSWPAEKIRRRISELRHDLLHIRKTLAPTRDAVREVVDGRVDIEGRTLLTREVFPREVEQHFATTYDKLLRATEGVEYARDLLSAARDYQQARVSIDQNEVVKRLTAIASILLVPTFIVGLYGQNFVHTPEYRWHYGYAWSWFLILTTTIAQIVYFRRKRWL
ncbi:MAG: magnesium transporter CorA family protein [Actinobacteria bacterium]|nr:MAG: magnesium transporter CorA family protein [Actinomycetota bacterium]